MNLREVIGSTADLYKNSDVNISVELSSKPSIVKADREQLIRVFNNLIKNGIQATPEAQKPDIAIRLTAEKNQWIIAIKDKGSGIPNELRNKIFVPNFTTKSSGMGLGLAMVKNIIESANGRIWFESEIDKGTVFYISFPVQEQD